MRNRSRPVLHIPRTSLETLLEALTALGIITALAMTVWGYFALPAIIPTHFGASGAPDAYGGKESLLILPIISICLAVSLTFLSRYPQIYNYPWPITAENAPRQYALARLLMCGITFEVVWMCCVLQWLLIQAAQSHSTGSFLLVVPVALLLALIVTVILYLLTAARAR
nr:DUF1648 domain-containing protein [Ktedonobacteraceae bacterium]